MQVGEAIARQGSLVHGCAGRSVAMHRIAKQLSKFGDATCFFPLNKQRVSLPPSSLASVASSPVLSKQPAVIQVMDVSIPVTRSTAQ